ncbi:helix-turn-helix transcriptional regulator [bacterium]|nr:helix-turn-helix transcriptional regulator [bacterium]
MAMLSKLLGQRIKDLRKRNKLTQAALADLIGMETTNLCKLENGGQLPKEENIEKIANALEVDVKDLFDFGYLKSSHFLRQELFKIINSASRNELEMYYKIIIATKEQT